MATESSQADHSRPTDWLALAGFVVVVVLFLFVSQVAGMRGMGVCMIIGAVRHHLAGRIAYGWEDRPPSGYLTGGLAWLMNGLFALIGIGMIVWPQVALGIFGWDRQ